LVLLACTFCLAVGPGYAAQKADDPDMKEISSYRLTMATLEKVAAVNRAMAQQMMQDPKVREAMKIDAELKALSDKDEPTEADQKRIEELEARKEQLEDAMDNPLGGESRTLAEMEARIRQYPPMMQALQRERMAPREYATFWLAFVQAAFAQGFQKAGMLKELPAGVNADNVRFVAEHEAEIQAMQKELEQLGKDAK
jgi:hypothetical protein